MQLITGLDVGGAERVVLDLSSELLDENVEVMVGVVSTQREILTHRRDPRLTVESLGIGKNPLLLPVALCHLVRLLHKHHVQVIHAHMFHALVLAMLCRLLKPSLRLVFTSHNTGASFGQVRRLFIRCTRRWRHADVIFTAGQHPELNAACTKVIANGTQMKIAERVRLPAVPARGKVIISVGRLFPQKDPMGLVSEFARLRHVDAELWLVGDGELRAELTAKVAELGLTSRVKMLGVRHDVADLLAQADLFVLGSAWEGMPIAILEAGASGIPVLATPVGCVPDVLGEDCGYMAQRHQLAEAMDAILDDYDEALVRAARLQQRVHDDYSMQAMCRSHIAIYRHVTGSTDTRRPGTPTHRYQEVV